MKRFVIVAVPWIVLWAVVTFALYAPKTWVQPLPGCTPCPTPGEPGAR